LEAWMHYYHQIVAIPLVCYCYMKRNTGIVVAIKSRMLERYGLSLLFVWAGVLVKLLAERSLLFSPCWVLEGFKSKCLIKLIEYHMFDEKPKTDSNSISLICKFSILFFLIVTLKFKPPKIQFHCMTMNDIC